MSSAATNGCAICCPTGCASCAAAKRSTATRPSAARSTTALRLRSKPTSTCWRTPPRPSSGPKPSRRRCRRSARASTTRHSAPSASRPSPGTRPPAQLLARQHPAHADHRTGLHRDQRLLHLPAGVVVQPPPPHRRPALDGRRGPHRGAGHRLPGGFRHGRDHRRKPQAAPIRGGFRPTKRDDLCMQIVPFPCSGNGQACGSSSRS